MGQRYSERKIVCQFRVSPVGQSLRRARLTLKEFVGWEQDLIIGASLR
jgi:hypothetical protein